MSDVSPYNYSVSIEGISGRFTPEDARKEVARLRSEGKHVFAIAKGTKIEIRVSDYAIQNVFRYLFSSTEGANYHFCDTGIQKLLKQNQQAAADKVAAARPKLLDLSMPKDLAAFEKIPIKDVEVVARNLKAMPPEEREGLLKEVIVKECGEKRGNRAELFRDNLGNPRAKLVVKHQQHLLESRPERPAEDKEYSAIMEKIGKEKLNLVHGSGKRSVPDAAGKAVIDGAVGEVLDHWAHITVPDETKAFFKQYCEAVHAQFGEGAAKQAMASFINTYLMAPKAMDLPPGVRPHLSSALREAALGDNAKMDAVLKNFGFPG